MVKSYSDAGYFGRTLCAVEVLIELAALDDGVSGA